jgi:hypothetical protein
MTRVITSYFRPDPDTITALCLDGFHITLYDTARYIGGFLGGQDANCTNCHSACKVTLALNPYHNEGTGGFCGSLSPWWNGSDPNDITNDTECYWDTDTSELLVSVKGTGKTTVEMMTQETFVDWDFVNKWAFVAGVYPYLRTALLVAVREWCKKASNAIWYMGI